jgi:hypothetical protein
LEKAREWAAAEGAPPSATDWNPADARAAARRSAERAARWTERAQRFDSGEWPWAGTVSKLFGRWNAMIEEAGMVPRTSPRTPLPEPPEGGLRAVAEALERAEAASGEDRQRLLYEVAQTALAVAEGEAAR